MLNLSDLTGPWTLKAWKLLSGALLLAGLAGIVADRPARGFLLRPFKGQELWIPTGWHKDSEGHDVKDTWDHYKMPDCDSGPAPGTKKKVILTPEQLKKMQAKKEKDQRVLEDEFWTTERLLPYGRRLRGVEERFLVDELADDHQERRRLARGRRGGRGPDTWQDLGGAESPAHCQRQCTWNRGCEGFSWSRWGCYLKRLEEHPKHNRSKDSSFTHKHVEEVYSGYPCDRKDSGGVEVGVGERGAMWSGNTLYLAYFIESPYPWINDELQKHSLPLPEVLHGRPPHVANASMFCTMLILPYTYEVQLTIMQHRSYYSIFLCDSWKVYSSQRLHLAPGLETHLVNTSQVAEMAGQWASTLRAFLAYWRALIQDGDYLKANWLVKVDPDTVWFPDRLVPILRQQEHSVHSMEDGPMQRATAKRRHRNPDTTCLGLPVFLANAKHSSTTQSFAVKVQTSRRTATKKKLGGTWRSKVRADGGCGARTWERRKVEERLGKPLCLRESAD
eukprot:g27485.t1